MKTILLCHYGAQLDELVIARWLNSFSNLVGIILIREPRVRVFRRIAREINRSGRLRLIDVFAFRLFYLTAIAPRDRRWKRQQLERFRRSFPDVAPGIPRLITPSPNSSEAEAFVRELAPDIMLARSKSMLREPFFSIPRKGTFVLHPGICPEYRNSHGCFWALANRDLNRVGMTLLRIDRGVDTGPVFGYYSYPYDERRESHVVIQYRVVLENLERLRDKLLEIFAGTAVPIDTSSRVSATWGQPWLTKFIKWKLSAMRRTT